MATIPVFASDEAIAALRRSIHGKAANFYAMYSSVLGGIVTDPALMVIPFDDHMVHRGHGIFDTAGLVAWADLRSRGALDRFLRSAGHSKLALPCPRERMREIIIQTVAASGQRDGADPLLDLVRARQPRAGPRGRRRARLLRHGVPGPVLSGAVVHRRPEGDDHHLSDQARALRHHQEHQLSAQRADADGSQGPPAWTTACSSTPTGHVGESSNMNVAFVTTDGVLRHPKFDRILPGITFCGRWNWPRRSCSRAC